MIVGNGTIPDLKAIARLIESNGLKKTAAEVLEAAACIEDLATALRPFAQVASKAEGVWRTKASDDYYFNGVKYGNYRNAHTTLVKWGLE